MIVQVIDEWNNNHFINVPMDNCNIARKVAFRFVLKRTEKDYNELVNHTRNLKIIDLSSDVASILMSHL